MDCLALAEHDVVGIRAANPGPLTLSGTNSWVVGRGPAWLVDPGPLLDDHLARLEVTLGQRGGLGGIVLTHDHLDHSEAAVEMRARHPGTRLAAARGDVDIRLADGSAIGPFRTLSLPGHTPDHLVFLAGSVAFTGDAVLGAGSVFIGPDPGALSGYLAGLRRLRALAPALLCPGHGPVVEDPQAKLDEYIEHRLDRERRLLYALSEGRRTVDELLDSAWGDAPGELRAVAAVTLAAHLDKLEAEDLLPAGVERPSAWPAGE